jgi:hypothetical protein
MTLYVPDDFTPLLFRLLACLLANQRDIMKMIDPECKQVKEMLTINDSVYSQLLPVLKKLQEIESSPRPTYSVSRAADVKSEPTKHSELCDASSRDGDTHADDIKPVAVTSKYERKTTSTDVSSISKPVPSALASSGQSGVRNNFPARDFVGDFKQKVAASKEEQKLRRHVLLVRGVMEAVTHGDELQLAQRLLSPCSSIARVMNARRIGTQRNILRVELDQPLARTVVDFFYSNRQSFTSSTMSVAPSRAPSLQRAVRRLHHLQQVIKDRLPQLNPQIIEGTGLRLCGTNHFTAYASLAQGLVLMNGDILPFSHLENPDHPIIIQKKDSITGDFYYGHDHFSQVD